MPALTASRQISQGDGPNFLKKAPVKASTVIYHGGMVGRSSGYWAPATTAIAPLGVADLSNWDDQNATGQQSSWGATTFNKIDNSAGADGARHFNVRLGVFKMNNKGGDLVDETMIGGLCYVENDNTVRKTSTSSVAAGIVVGIDEDGGVFVAIGAGAVSGYAQM
jgi:hypothetical protein